MMKSRWTLLLALALALTACTTQPPTPTATLTPSPAVSPTPTITPTRPVTPWPTLTPRPVVGQWVGQIYSTGGAQYDDYIRLVNQSPVLQYGLTSAIPAVEAEIVALRDTDHLAQVTGELVCGVTDYGGCRIQVSRIDDLEGGAVPPKLEAWRGVVESAEAGSGFDDRFRLADSPDHAYGIIAADPGVAARLDDYRDTGTVLQVEAGLTCPAEDYGGCQLEVFALEVDRLPTPAPVLEAFLGRIFQAEPPYDDYLSVGTAQYGVAAEDPALQAALESFRDMGAMVQVIGSLQCNVDDVGGCRVLALRIDALDTETPAPRFEWFEGVVQSAETGSDGDAVLVIDDGFETQTYPLVAGEAGAETAIVQARDAGVTVRVAGWMACGALDQPACEVVALYVEPQE